MGRRSIAPIFSPVPRNDESGRTVFRWLLAACAAANIAPLYLAEHLPFSDLPEHVAAISTVRHYWDPAWGLQKYFVLQGLTRTPYFLYDVVAALLSVPFGSAERANLFILSLVGLGFPYSLRELLRATHRDERLAFFACPLFWSRALGEGLLNYVASLPVGIWGLALVARQCEGPTRRRAWLLAGVSLAIFYLHVSTFVFFALGAVILFLFLPVGGPATTRAGELRERALRVPRQLVWLVPTVAAAGLLLLSSPLVHPNPTREGIHAGVVRFSSTMYLVRSLPGWMHDFWRSNIDDVAGVIAWGLLGVLFLRRARAPESPSPADRAALVLGFFPLVLYFVTPNQVSFAFILDLRLAPLVGVLAPLVVRVRRDRVSDVAIAGMAAVAFVVGAHSAWQTHRFEREEAASFDRVMVNLPRGKKLVTLVFDRESRRANITPFIHFGSYYSARYGGVSSFSFAEVPHWPIQYRPGFEPPKKEIVFWDWNPCLFRNTIDGRYYDFVLTRGEENPFSDEPPGPIWQTIGISQEWTLFAKTGAERVTAGNEPDRGPCKGLRDARETSLAARARSAD